MIELPQKLNSILKHSLPLFLVAGAWLGLVPERSAIAQTVPTNINVTANVQQRSVHRLGVNLGDQTYWDSGQMLKNLVFQNPGFEGMKYRSIFYCAVATATTCQDNNQGSPQPTGFWTGGTYYVMSGNAAGATGTVVSSTGANNAVVGAGQTLQFDQNLNLSSGDYVSVVNYFPGSGTDGWWASTSGGATITTEMTDLSPETPGKQALLLSASGSGQSAGVVQYFDGWTGISFVQLNGSFQVTFRAKGVGGNNQLSVLAQRLGYGPYTQQTLTLTNQWQDYTLTFSAAETGKAIGTVQLVFNVSGSNVELDDVSWTQTNSSASNTSPFRDGVVQALKELNPGTIRMMASAAGLGSDVINQIQVPFARYREGFNIFGTKEDDIAYGIHEFLQLCQVVGADPYMTIPTATTPEEMTEFIQYLTGDGSDPYSALRISRGQVQPWTTVFNKIHIELGNETWNAAFKGEWILEPQYGQWANAVFGAARKTPGFQASNFDLVLSGFSASAGYNQGNLAASTEHDSMDIAPYLLSSAKNEPQETMFGALFAEPEMYESPGGRVYEVLKVAAAAPTPTHVNVYETNLSTTGGSITEAQVNGLTPSIGAGIAHTDHMLQMMRLGVKYQNAFALPQYGVNGGPGLVKLWGIVVDMGNTNRRRPQFLTQAMANSVIGGDMLQTVHTGTNPTWNQPLSSDNVQFNGAHYLQSFAFSNEGTVSVIVFNLNQTTGLPVTFSGPNAPTGAVEMTQITSTNITDNNETSDTVRPVRQTLSGFNPASGMTLPPFSMTALTWTPATAATVQEPLFSLVPGTYTSTQDVTITDGTSGATIYYTTDGSTPTSSSTKYTEPVAVSSSTTLKAIAISSGTSSPVATASYVIEAPAAAPEISLAAGTYTGTQVIKITDATPNATIYFTLSGNKPTAFSTKYVGPFKLENSATLQAIAVATGMADSPVTSAKFIINQPTAEPTFSVPAGKYNTAKTVAIEDATKGATIYYTTNGEAPTASSTRYTAPISVSKTETLSAIAVANSSTSSVATATYTITTSTGTAAPSFSVPGGTYDSTQTVAITDTTKGATIYYTTNGSKPTATSAKYTAPLSVSKSETLSAIAVAGDSTSSVASAVYTITEPTGTKAPTFSIDGGTYNRSISVTISDATRDAVIYYTADGSKPTASSTKYTGAILVGASETLKAIAIAGTSTSPVTTEVYVIGSGKPTPAPTFNLSGGKYNDPQTIVLKDTVAGAKIYYTTDGSAPTAKSTLYTVPFKQTATETIRANAIAPGQTLSTTAEETYELVVGKPSLSVSTGVYSKAVKLTISDVTPDASLYYTTNESNPTAKSTPYTGPITISSATTIKVIGIKSGYAMSAVATATYSFGTPAATPLFEPSGGTFKSTVTVKIEGIQAGATVYYTTDGAKPDTHSAKYTKPITVAQTETLKAVQINSDLIPSAIATAAFTITSTTTDPGEFTAGEMTLHGAAAVEGGTLKLTNGTVGETAAAWYSKKVAVDHFTSEFTFVAPKSNANGMTFTLQNAPDGNSATGGAGVQMGYSGIKKSVAVLFSLYDEASHVSASDTGLLENGASLAGQAISMESAKISLHAGHQMHVLLTYDGTTLRETVTDTATHETFTHNYAVNIASILGSSTAWVGFTGSTGATTSLTAVQNVLNWTFTGAEQSARAPQAE
jgi:hypothetical protein